MNDFRKSILAGVLAGVITSIITGVLWACVPEPVKQYISSSAQLIFVICLLIGVLVFIVYRQIILFFAMGRIKNTEFPLLTTSQFKMPQRASFLTTLKSIDETFRIMRSDLGVIDYYVTRNKAIEENEAFLRESSRIETLNFKCKVLINEDDSIQTLAYKLATDSKKQIRCLVLNPNGSADKYIQKRIDELNENTLQTDSNIEYHKKKIKDQVADLKSINESCTKNITCRYFCEVLKWSLFITDSFLLLSFYGSDTSDKAPCFKIEKQSRWGKALVKYFEDLWESNVGNKAFDKA